MALLNLIVLNPSMDQQQFMDAISYNFDQVISIGPGPIGLTGLTGGQGIPGNQGIQGLTGPAGQPGSAWYVNAFGPPTLCPTPAAGVNNGDFWFDTSSLQIFEVIGGCWQVNGTLTTSNTFRYVSSANGQVMFDINTNPTDETKSLVLSGIDYSSLWPPFTGTADVQPGPYKLKVIGLAGTPQVVFAVEETIQPLFACNGEALQRSWTYVEMDRVSHGLSAPSYQWTLVNQTDYIRLQVNGNDFISDLDGMTRIDSNAIVFDTSDTVYRRINFSNTATLGAFPGTYKLGISLGTETNSLPGGPYTDVATFTDYGYTGINNDNPVWVLDLIVPNPLVTTQPVASFAWNAGWATDTALTATAIALAGGQGNRSAIRLDYVTAEVSSSPAVGTSSFIQLGESNNGLGLIKMGVHTSGTYTGDGSYFFGNDIFGQSGFGSPNFIIANTDLASSPIWPATLNVQSNAGSPNLENYTATYGSIHLYEEALTDNYYTGITSGGMDPYNTRFGLLFQDEPTYDGAKAHIVTSRAGVSNLQNRFSVWGSGQLIHWSDTAFANPTARFGLVIDTNDHATGVVASYIRNTNLGDGTGSSTSALLNGIPSIGSTEGNIIIAPITDAAGHGGRGTGFVGIGPVEIDLPQTTLQVEGAVTFGERKVITNYSTQVGQNSVVIAGDNSAGSGGHRVTGFRSVIIGPQTDDGTLGINLATSNVVVLASRTAINAEPVSTTPWSFTNNVPLFASRSYNGNGNNLTITMPSQTGTMAYNGLEVEQWLSSTGNVAYGRSASPLQVSLYDIDHVIHDTAAGAGTSIVALAVDEFGQTTINSRAFTGGLIAATPLPVTRHTPYPTSLTVGPAPYDFAGNVKPDDFVHGSGSDWSAGAGSITLSTPGIFGLGGSPPVFPAWILGTRTVPLSAKSARIATSDISVNGITATVVPNPFEIYAGKTTNTNGDAYGQDLKITAGETGSSGTSVGGRLILRGGFGNRGGDVQISSGGGAEGAPNLPGRIFVDLGTDVTPATSADVSAIYVGTRSDLTQSGANVNVDGTFVNVTATNTVNITAPDGAGTPTINVTGQVSMVTGIGNSTIFDISLLWTATNPSPGTVLWAAPGGGNGFDVDASSGGTGGITKNQWQPVLDRAPYDRFMNVRTLMDGAVHGSGGGYATANFSLDGSGSTVITSCSPIFANVTGEQLELGDSYPGGGSGPIQANASFFVPAGRHLYISWSAVSNPTGTSWSPRCYCYMQFMETKLGL